MIVALSAIVATMISSLVGGLALAHAGIGN